MILQLLSILLAAWAPTETTSAPTDQRRLLLLVPEQAPAAVYVRNCSEALSSPVPAWLIGQAERRHCYFVGPLIAAARRVDGPALAVLLTWPTSDEPLPLFVALDLAGSDRTPDQFIAQDLLPVLPRSATTQPRLQHDGLLGEIVVEDPPASLHWTSRAQQLLLCTNRQVLADLQAGKWPGEKLLLSQDYAPLAAQLAPDPQLWAYLALPPLYPLAGPFTARDPVLQQLYWVLGVENFRAVAMQVQADGSSVALRLVCRFQDQTKGLMHLLAGPNTASQATNLLPPTCPAFLRLAISDLPHAIASLNDLIQQTEPAVVSEFQSERTSFKTEIGFDPLDDLASLIRHEILAALIPLNAQTEALVFITGLADPDEFRRHVETLSQHFKLTWTQHERSGFVMGVPTETDAGFTYAVGHGLLLISRHPDAIRALTASAPTSRPASADTRLGSVPLEHRVLLHLDWARAARWITSLTGAHPAQVLASLGFQPRAVVLAASTQPATVTLDCILTSEPEGGASPHPTTMPQ